MVKVVYILGDSDSYETKEIEMSEAQAVAFMNIFKEGEFVKGIGYTHGALFKKYASLCLEEEPHEHFVNTYAFGIGRMHQVEVLWYDAYGIPHNVEFL